MKILTFCLHVNIAASNKSIPLKEKIQGNDSLAFRKTEMIGTTSTGSVVAEIFNLKDTSKLLNQHFRSKFDQL